MVSDGDVNSPAPAAVKPGKASRPRAPPANQPKAKPPVAPAAGTTSFGTALMSCQCPWLFPAELQCLPLSATVTALQGSHTAECGLSSSAAYQQTDATPSVKANFASRHNVH